MRPTKRVDPFYLSPAWRKLRAQVIAEQPTCASPYCGKPTKHVDHRESRRKRPDLALSRTNLIGYCWSCHSRKTASRDGGFGNPAGTARSGCGADGMPLDPSHPWTRRA